MQLLGNFKILLILLVVIVLGVLGWFLISGSTKKDDEKVTVKEGKKVTIIKKGGGESAVDNWPQGSSGDLKVSYPSDWKFTPRKIVGNGGTSATIIPNGFEGLNPIIIVQGTPAEKTPLDRVKGVFGDLKYESEEVEINGTPATRFWGAIPPTGEAAESRLYERAVVFEKNGTVYLVKLNYQAASENAELVKIFDEVVLGLGI